MPRVTQFDTMERVVTQHFAALTRVPIVYKGRTILPRPLVVSPLMFRDFNCPSGCGACCRMCVSLDFIPGEPVAKSFQGTWRDVEVNNKKFRVFTDWQYDRDDWCRYLRTADGRCSIHHLQGPDQVQPAECDFAYLVFSISEGVKPNRMTNRLPGRVWARKRITDGGKGGKCSMTEYSDHTIPELLRKMDRLKLWLDYFEQTDTNYQRLRDWISSGPHTEPLYLNEEFAPAHPMTVRLPVLES